MPTHRLVHARPAGLQVPQQAGHVVQAAGDEIGVVEDVDEGLAGGGIEGRAVLAEPAQSPRRPPARPWDRGSPGNRCGWGAAPHSRGSPRPAGIAECLQRAAEAVAEHDARIAAGPCREIGPRRNLAGRRPCRRCPSARRSPPHRARSRTRPGGPRGAGEGQGGGGRQQLAAVKFHRAAPTGRQSLIYPHHGRPSISARTMRPRHCRPKIGTS